MGYRMPAEWEPVDRIWLTTPHNRETWPGCFGRARKQYATWVDAMRRHVRASTTARHGVATDDSWVRDYGPLFVVHDEPTDDRPRLACHDFQFNGWGGKYEVRRRDNAVPKQIARKLGLPCWSHDLVLEGGSIDVNGAGTVLTTRQCLLNPNRNPGRTAKQIERELHEALGTTHAIWLPGGIVGDDTDGHVDDIARFIAADTVAAVRAPRGHDDADVLNANFTALRAARDQAGRRLTIVELPAPEPIVYRFPPDRFGPGGEAPVPASYANFLFANRAVFVPVFGQPSDDRALRTLADALPQHTIVPVRAEWLVVGLGALHCLSMQQPK